VDDKSERSTSDGSSHKCKETPNGSQILLSRFLLALGSDNEDATSDDSEDEWLSEWDRENVMWRFCSEIDKIK
jgi:hypothetical protein